MFELTEASPAVDVPESEYQRLLGYPKNHTPGERSRELADGARQWFAQNGRPWIYAREVDALDFRDGRLLLAGCEFSSPVLHDSLAAARAHSAVLAVVSVGKECEEMARRLWQESKPDEYFFLEVYGSAVVEHLVALASGRICGWADRLNLAVLPHYSPGYTGWDIADQIKLWNLIVRNQPRGFPGELTVLETGMLRPKKSLLAVFGLTREVEQAHRAAKLIPCETCSLPRCQYRRSPYQQAPPQMEDLLRLQSASGGRATGPAERSTLNRQAKYSVNVPALQKWSRERLRLEILPGGLIAADFRYDGTTCSNLGCPLEFNYRVKLAAASDDYKILETSCAPAPGDTGHARQCAYLSDAGALMQSIATERPLLGRPLNEVLAWVRPPNPSGCYCDQERRNHKWGLVFEVIHFALVQREAEAGAAGNP
jgi:hypothetical protein